MLGIVAGLLAGGPSSLRAQTCQVNNQASCTVAGDATRSITVGVGYVARLILSSSTVNLPSPNVASYDATVSSTGTLGIIVRANTGWQVLVRATAATWTGTPLSARQNKPVGDLQWSLLPASGFVSMTTTLAIVISGGATAGTNATLYLRSALDWTLDGAGNYQIPLEVTITSP